MALKNFWPPFCSLVATAVQPLKAGFGGYDAYEYRGYRRCGDGEVDSVSHG